MFNKISIKYTNKYGLNPEFKAGVNSGSVTVAEVGEMKREIVYHSDAINTALKIQDVCQDYDKDLLISEVMKKKLD